MHPVLIAVIAITVIISLAGFQNVSVFEKYKFNRATGRTDRSVWPFWFR